MAVQRRSWQRIWWRSAARFGEDNKFKPNSIGSGFINWAEWPGETDPCGYKCNSWPWVEEDTMTNLVNNKEEVIVKKGRLPAAQTAVVIISSQTAVMIISKRISPRHNRQQERSCIVMSSGTVLCLQAHPTPTAADSHPSKLPYLDQSPHLSLSLVLYVSLDQPLRPFK